MHRDADQKIVEIELERLRSFANHTFKVQADSQMIEMQEVVLFLGLFTNIFYNYRNFWIISATFCACKISKYIKE